MRALIAGARAEPGLNAWYDSKTIGRHIIGKIDLGLAVDSPDGLFVPVLRNVDTMPPEKLSGELQRLIADSKIGSRVRVEFMREGQRQTADVPVVQRAAVPGRRY